LVRSILKAVAVAEPFHKIAAEVGHGAPAETVELIMVCASAT